MKLYTLYKTQDPESHLIPCTAAHTRIGRIWKCTSPHPSPANNAAQINKVSTEFQFRHRRPKLKLRLKGDAWRLCWTSRYAPRYRWTLKIRDFVWEIKYWDLRTLNNVKFNLRSMYCTVFWSLVVIVLFFFFWALLHNHCHSLHKTKSRLVITKTGSIIYV